jgi:hypothetical protein
MNGQDRDSYRKSTHRPAPIDAAEPEGDQSVIETRGHDHHDPEAEQTEILHEIAP